MTLKELRVSAGKSCAEAAKELNVTVSAYSHYEQGSRRLNVEQILPLSKLYDVEAVEIVDAAIRTLNNCQ